MRGNLNVKGNYNISIKDSVEKIIIQMYRTVRVYKYMDESNIYIICFVCDDPITLTYMHGICTWWFMSERQTINPGNKI